MSRVLVVAPALSVTVLAAAVGWGGADRIVALTLTGAAAFALLLALVDVAVHRLPDPLVAALAAWTLGGLSVTAVGGDPRPLRLGVVSAAVVLVIFFVLACLVRNGMGLGDVKLAAVLALTLGWHSPAAVAGFVVVALALNGVVAATMMLLRRRSQRRAAGMIMEVPLGPSLVVSVALCWLSVLG